ncbi:lysis regulatory protein-like protein [uncultured phage cr52_1]|uniref:Lysis regulatory protein-like protein n=1 Tax=uncultured phage cr52_1 TaxID=2772079 RepID=A0A7M1RRW4_9CAUD|nr:lysis regulatory protein-like protein [uncultured phage cr52_1]QOR56641.1 lysis regulatory protein-like protein [uncultured phage cr52_1]
MLSEIKSYLSKLAVIIIIGLTAFCFYLSKKILVLDERLGQVTNNYEYYQSLTSRLRDDNRTLQLKVVDLNNSNDSLLLTAKEVLKELKIKDKNLLLVQVINTEMKDTITKIITKEVDFKEDLKLNPLTTITVERKDSILTAILDLRNSQVLFVEEKKEYRNKYKNGFLRFLHFDWKKDRIRKYQIYNSNDLIKVTDTRIVEVTE